MEKYLMITHYDELWENGGSFSGEQKYEYLYIDDNIIDDLSERETIFVKIDKNTKEVLHIYEGEVDNIKRQPNLISFNFKNLKEVSKNKYNIQITQERWRYIIFE